MHLHSVQSNGTSIQKVMESYYPEIARLRQGDIGRGREAREGGAAVGRGSRVGRWRERRTMQEMQGREAELLAALCCEQGRRSCGQCGQCRSRRWKRESREGDAGGRRDAGEGDAGGRRDTGEGDDGGRRDARRETLEEEETQEGEVTEASSELSTAQLLLD